MWSLNLARIRTPSERFDRVYRPEDFAAFPRDAFEVVSPVAVGFDIHKDGDRFRLAGSVQGTLRLACCRCLEPFTLAVDGPFDLQYEPRPGESATREREVHDRDFSTAYYDDQEIDLAQLVSEQFHLALPMKPLCSATCRGLCPQCGANLNRETCTCVRDWDDPRLAVLKQLAGHDPRNH